MIGCITGKIPDHPNTNIAKALLFPKRTARHFPGRFRGRLIPVQSVMDIGNGVISIGLAYACCLIFLAWVACLRGHNGCVN